MTNSYKYIILVSLVLFSLNGCAQFPLSFFNPAPLLGLNIQDLKEACADGNEKTVALPYDTAFTTVKNRLENSGLTIYQCNRPKGYIVAIDFPKDVDTTRLGVFFKSIDKDHTSITLSSLSSIVLNKATPMVFDNLK
ncbi:MAG: hypothetical protein ABIH85_01680 [Candidatus Omnitrophota bacterium]|nr:hypothetical protein [Candidatus Omnitrophota bacterium]MBU1894628.1 hypothetical protein [Candidatus Omnitrophota bacterium]